VQSVVYLRGCIQSYINVPIHCDVPFVLLHCGASTAMSSCYLQDGTEPAVHIFSVANLQDRPWAIHVSKAIIISCYIFQ